MSKAKIIFITGTSGAGKTTLKELLKELSSETIKIHDFDEVGVPEGADHHWRIQVSTDWLNYAKANRKEGIHTLIIGQTSPKEISEISSSLNIPNISYGFIDISEKLIRERLTDRHWDEALIDANVGWAHALKNQLLEVDDYIIYDGNSGDEQELLAFYKNWILEQVG